MQDSKIKLALYTDPAFQSSAGIEQYTRKLIQGICESDVAGSFVFFSTRAVWAAELASMVQASPASARPSIVMRAVPRRRLKLTWAFAGFPSIERMVGQELALVHNPSAFPIPARCCPLLITVHDVFPIKDPSLMALRDRVNLWPQMLSTAICRANHIIADSENTKRDVHELFKQQLDKITVVPLGVDHDVFKPVDDTALVRRVTGKYGIDGKFILYVGSLYARKVGKLLDGYKIACAPSPAHCKLVMVGGRESRTTRGEDIRTRIVELGLEDKVILTGVVPREDLPVLMSAAEVFVYVSFFEGFGLSPLEAMACGAPVVVSNATSLPEVVGDAGFLVDPIDERAIAGAITRVLSDPRLQEKMSQNSLRRAALFSWEKTVQQTLNVYRKVAQCTGGKD